MGIGSDLAAGIGLGAIGAIGGIFSSRARRKAAERFKRNQQAGIQEARDRTEDRVSALLDNPVIEAANNFLLESFEGTGGPLADQFQRRLEVAQESRGLRRSRAGAVAEASSLAAFSQQFKASLLPQAERFGTLGERFRTSILSQETPISIGFHTGAQIPGISNLSPELADPVGFDPLASAFQGFAQGAAGGFQISQGFSNQRRFNDQLAAAKGASAGGGSGGVSPFNPLEQFDSIDQENRFNQAIQQPNRTFRQLAQGGFSNQQLGLSSF